MASYYFPRFSEVGLLRQFNFPLLYQFLLPYQDYLCAKYDLRWTDNPDTFPFQQLVGILALPDKEMPDMLCNGLFFINALSNSASAKRIYTALHYENLLPNIPPAWKDCALYAWLVNPGILQSIHSELASEKYQKTECLFGRHPAYPDLSQERLIALENDLNVCTDLPSKRHGIQVMFYPINDMIVFHFRHGELLRSGKIIKHNGIIKRIVNRPERYDFLVYEPQSGKLIIYSKDSWVEGELYVLFGKHLLSDINFFVTNDKARCYTLTPLLEQGRDSLICSDIDGLEHSFLKELHTEISGKKKGYDIFKAEKCLFEERGSLDWLTGSKVKLVQASFQMQVVGFVDLQTLTICPPNATIFDRRFEFTKIFEQWLKKRSFIRNS